MLHKLHDNEYNNIKTLIIKLIIIKTNQPVVIHTYLLPMHAFLTKIGLEKPRIKPQTLQ